MLWHVCGGQRAMGESFLSFLPCGSGDGTPVIMLDSKHLCSLTHPTSSHCLPVFSLPVMPFTFQFQVLYGGNTHIHISTSALSTQLHSSIQLFIWQIPEKKKYFYLSKTYLIILFLCDSTVSNYSCQTKAPAISRDWGVIRDVTSWSSIQVYRTRTWTARRQQSVFFSKLLCNSDAQQSLETTGLWIIQPVSVTAETWSLENIVTLVSSKQRAGILKDTEEKKFIIKYNKYPGIGGFDSVSKVVKKSSSRITFQVSLQS